MLFLKGRATLLLLFLPLLAVGCNLSSSPLPSSSATRSPSPSPSPSSTSVAAPTVLHYSNSNAVYTDGLPIPINSPANSGGAITSFSVNPSLPAGLSLNTSTGVISGTPTATAAVKSYTVTGSNSGGSTTVSLSITVGTASISVSSGNNQSGTSGSALSSPFIAITEDASGAPLSGAVISWLVTAGGGSLSSASSTTGSNGLSSSTLTLGSSSGTNTVTATIQGSFYSTTFTATATGGGSSGSAYLTDLATISTRQTNQGYPRLANDTQVSYGGNSANGNLGSSLFSRLHWYDYLVIDGNNSPTTTYTTLTSFLGYKGSIRSLNPNSVQVAYFSLADFSNSAPNICYQPLLTYYAFGPNFSVSGCSDPGTDDFSSSWMYHDTSGNTLDLYNFGSYYSHVPDPSTAGFQARYQDAVQTKIIANQNFDGLYQDWGGFATIPYLGDYSTVSLLNNGVDNLGGIGNITNINNAVNVDWQNGLLSLYSQERAAYPANFILAGNSGWGGTQVLSSFTNAVQGTQLEDFLNAVASSEGWQGAMYTYGTWATNGQSPNFAFIQADLSYSGSTVDADHMLYDLMVSSGNNWITSTQLQQLRFGLTSALMFNGYFASSITNASGGGYSAAFWLDEFAVNSSGTAVVPTDATATVARAAKGWLGSPLASAYNVNSTSQTLWSVLSAGPNNSASSSVWRRDYTNGIVIVNPTGSSQTVSLGGTFKKIHGVVDPTVNNGATGVTSITLSSQSGMVLHR